MHELSIAEDLTRIVLETARESGLKKVTEVNIIFGQMIQVVPDIFEFAFRECARGTVAQDARLNIEIRKVRMKCIRCGSYFDVQGNRFVCNCGSSDLEIISGKELFIKSIEGEQ
jgi:hydrogenase nickel incorporation protein HypA/HybF